MTTDPAATHRWAINAVIPATDEQMLEASVNGSIQPQPGMQAIIDAGFCTRCAASWEEGKDTPCGVAPE